MIRVDFHAITDIPDDSLKYAVIMAEEDGRWLISRHRDRATWEIPGGHREAGESIREAGVRELYEETGVTDADLTPVEVYSVTREDGVTSYGMLFLARVKVRGELPKLFSRVQYRLNINTNAQEMWDVLDEHRQPTGRIHPRGVPLPQGDYHLVVLVLLQNDHGEFLTTRRAPNKGYPGMWEFTGGSALAGDDSLHAALREMREETGIELDPACGRVVASEQWSDSFCDVWLFRQNFDPSAVVLQEGETTAAMVTSREKIMRMEREGKFIPFTPALKQVFETELR